MLLTVLKPQFVANCITDASNPKVLQHINIILVIYKYAYYIVDNNISTKNQLHNNLSNPNYPIIYRYYPLKSPFYTTHITSTEPLNMSGQQLQDPPEPPKFGRIQKFLFGDTIQTLNQHYEKLTEQQQQQQQEQSLTRKMMALQDTTAVAPDLTGFTKFDLNRHTPINDQKKMRTYTKPLSYRQSYEATSGEIVSFPPEAIDKMIYEMNANSTSRPMLMARKRELTRNGLQLTHRFACLCNVCGTKYDNVVEMCDECENTEEQYGFTLPSQDEKDLGEEWIDPANNVNPNFQNLLELLKENQEYVDIIDDCWFVLENSYTTANGLILDTEVEEVWVKHPGNMSWSVHPQTNKIGRYRYTCVKHRQFVTTDSNALCSICGGFTYNVIAQSYKPGTNDVDKFYILNEVLHSSLHRPSATYGFPPAITLRYELGLTTNQMAYMASYYDDIHYHKIPGYLLLPTGSSWEDVWESSKKMRRKLKQDPHQVGILPYKPTEGGGGKPEFVKFENTPKEMEFIPVRDEARQRMAAFYGVSPVFQADVSQGGGLNNEGLQFTVTNRAVEDAQQAMNRNVLAPLSRLIGLTDWVIELVPSEEQDEIAEIEQNIKQAQYVSQVVQINPARFEARFNSQGELEVIENEVDDPDNPYDDLFSEDYEGDPTEQTTPGQVERQEQSFSADKYEGRPSEPQMSKMSPDDILDTEKPDYYTFTRDIPDWEWSDDYEFVEFRTVEIDDIKIHPDFEITEQLVDEGSSRVRPKTLVYYLAKADTMDPLVVDSNQNLMDGHHRMYCLKVKEQQTVDIAVFKAKDDGSTFRKMQVKSQERAPKGGVTIDGTYYKGGLFIPSEVMDDLSDEEREAVREGRDVGEVDSAKDDSNPVDLSDSEKKVAETGKGDKETVETLMKDPAKYQSLPRQERFNIARAGYEHGFTSNSEVGSEYFATPIDFGEDNPMLLHGSRLDIKDMGAIFGDNGSLGKDGLYVTDDMQLAANYSAHGRGGIPNVMFVTKPDRVNQDVYLDPDPYNDEKNQTYGAERENNQYYMSDNLPVDEIKDVIVYPSNLDDEDLKQLDKWKEEGRIIHHNASMVVFPVDKFKEYLEEKGYI